MFGILAHCISAFWRRASVEFRPSHRLPPVTMPYWGTGQLCCSHLEKLLTMPVSLCHRVLSGSILLADSKPHSPVLEAGKRNIHFLDNMWALKPHTPYSLGFSQREITSECWEPQAKSHMSSSEEASSPLPPSNTWETCADDLGYL